MGSQAGSSQEVIWGRAFSISIYFMLFMVLGLVIYFFYRVHRVIKAEEQRHSDQR
ncbi:MAG TPA: hypothetical protein VKX17_10365 [Planctomycetota bacterium]|nr:hypothetical protein [Planctomycetota bacterium]